MMYTNEYHGYLPFINWRAKENNLPYINQTGWLYTYSNSPAALFTTPTNVKTGSLFTYLRNIGVYHCPVDTGPYPTNARMLTSVFPGRSHEAPALFKHAEKYYMITSGCTGWEPNAARSTVADSIWGPWVELGNPCVGPDSELTFHSQSTCVIPVASKPGTLIFAADRLRPDNAIDGRYLWLPIELVAHDRSCG